MIEPVTMYQAVCDMCGKVLKYDDDIVAWTNPSDARFVALESEWEEHDGKLYCPECADKLFLEQEKLD